jgi:hypothetical protein
VEAVFSFSPHPVKNDASIMIAMRDNPWWFLANLEEKDFISPLLR